MANYIECTIRILSGDFDGFKNISYDKAKQILDAGLILDKPKVKRYFDK